MFDTEYKCHKNIIEILDLSLKQSHIGLEWLDQSKGLGLVIQVLDYQKTIFKCLVLLDYSVKKFRRSWMAK